MSRTIKKFPLPGVPTPEPQPWEAHHAALSRQAAAEGIVLLINKNQILPLAEGTPLALYGAGAYATVKGGTGSGDVNERYQVNIMDGLKNAGFPLVDEDWLNAYVKIYNEAREVWRQAVLERAKTRQFFYAYSLYPFTVPDCPKVTKADADTAVYVISRNAGEALDRSAEGADYYLSQQEHEMLADICKLYTHVIVLVNAGGVIDLSFLDEFANIEALLIVSQPGMEGGNAIGDVLTGRVTPSGRLTDTWAFQYEDYPNSATFSHNNGNVEKEPYTEGIYVGYRYFDSFDVPVCYGFGEGLSYTTFDITAGAMAVAADGSVTVPVTVTNTGAAPGAEVVQSYVALPGGRLEKEHRRLAAFGKTAVLAPGASETVNLTFGPEELSSYDEAAAAWVLEAGDYVVFVGHSLRESAPVAVLRLEAEKVLEKTVNICPLVDELEELSCPNRKSAGAEGLAVSLWDLSAVPTRVVDYDAEPDGDDEAARITAGLSEEQLILMATGDPSRSQDNATFGQPGSCVPGSAAETSSCALENGVANIMLADGPAGLRLNQFYFAKDGTALAMPFETALEHGIFYDGAEVEGGTKYYQYCTAIPVGTMLAQTWNLPLIEELGEMVGDEVRRMGVTLWLAPGMNIHRNPLCGRNFEYYSEDPLLSGKFAAATTLGVQKGGGCGTTIKHFACNNQEDNRMGSDSILSERALREIYLRGFGIAIRESHPFAIMTSYNLINGVHAANCYDTCTLVARKEFGFDGLIMTDWTTTEQGLTARRRAVCAPEMT